MQAVADHRETQDGLPRSEALDSVTPAGLEGRFHAWRGRSGRRYVVSVYPAGAAPDYAGAVVLAVRRRGAERTVLAVAAVEPGMPAPAFPPGEVDELHFHLLAPDAKARATVADDLGGAMTAPAASGLRRG